MNFKNITRSGIAALVIGWAGCATPDLPRGARLVGGGLTIEYTAPSDGTAILIERTSGRIVATESVAEGSEFQFYPGLGACNEVLFSLFAPANAINTGECPLLPTNTVFQLYFVPDQARKE